MQARARYFWLGFALLGVLLSGCQEQLNYPAPRLAKTNPLSPASISANQPGFDLGVNGANFTPASTVLWNGSPRTTIFGSTSQLTAQITAVDIENAGTAMVEVTTPQPGGGTTLPATFTINPVSNPVPQISSLSPSGAFTGADGFSLTVFGSNFSSEATVTVNSQSRSTGFANSTELTAQILASDVAQAGTLQIGVVNPQPNGGSSNIFNFNVSNPAPGAVSVSPSAAVAGAAATVVTVTGTGFVPTSVVNINGSPRATTFTNITSLQATLSAGDLASAGIYILSVTSPSPGGGTSNTITFAVNGTPIAGLPVMLDLAPDGSLANNGVCGASCNSIPTLQTAGPSSDGNGQFVAFASNSTNLVLNQTNSVSNIFLRSTCLTSTSVTASSGSSCVPATTKVTRAVNGTDANGSSSQPSIDSAGAHVAYTSTATNLENYAPVSANQQVYWQETCASSTSTAGCTGSTALPALVSIAPDGLTPGNGNSYDPVVSPDGAYVAFVSLATNLVANVTVDGITPQVYLRNTCSLVPPATSSCVPTTYLVSTPDGTTPANAPASSPTISNTGLWVAFVSAATNLPSPGANPDSLSEVIDRSTCATTIGVEGNTCVPATSFASTPDGVSPANSGSVQPSISSDGRFVAFASTATNLIPGIGPTQEIYVRDTCTGETGTGTVAGCTPSTQLVSSPDSSTPPSTPANALSENPSVNGTCTATSTALAATCATGQFIAFSSFASNLGANVENGIENVFVRDTCNGVSTVVTTVTSLCLPYTFLSSQPAGAQPPPANGSSIEPSISGDGASVSFISSANNLVVGDTNGVADVFLGAANLTFTLTVTLQGTGSGTVTDDTGQISCVQTAATGTTPLKDSGTCTATYPSGTLVTLTANATTGFSFTGWSGSATSVTGASCLVTSGSTTNGTCEFAEIANNTVTATFK